jgi:phosphoglycolate phosphatase-like HAD superfamily hydrolase
MKKLFLGMILSLAPFYVKAQNKNPDKAPWVYFDLGDTVISTADMKHLHYFKGVRDYMEDLKRQGFKIGIITNIPETFGVDYDEKLLTLKKVIADGWEENNEMKPAPTLFVKAMNKAEGCPTAYIGESPKEIKAADDLGMATKLFVANDSELYVPVDKMNKYMKDHYRNPYDSECM